MTTRILGTQIQAGTIQTEQLSNTTTAAFATSADIANFATSLAPKVSSVNVANSAFTVLDDTAVNTGGGYIVVTGTNFAEGVTVLIDTTAASAVSRINSTTLQVQVPPKSAASYNLFVINPDGGTGIRVNGITYSGLPTWVTGSPLTSQIKDLGFSINLSATAATTYSVANNSTLPADTTLLANGYFYGNITSISVETTYSFDVVAIDAENQDASKTFALTVTVVPPQTLFVTGRLENILNPVTYTTATTTSPVQLTSTRDWSTMAIDGNSETIYGIKLNGTLWAWGKNNNGQLGQNDTISRSSPVQIGALTDWSKIWASGEFFIALKTNGTIWAAGNGGYSGNLGQNDRVNRSSPVQIGSDTWLDINIGSSRVLGIKSNGTMWTWGYSGASGAGAAQRGTNGLNDATFRSSPAQVGGSTWLRFFKSTNNYAVRAIRSDTSLWAWGSNVYYGFNADSRKNTPTQWSSVTNWKEGAISNQGSSNYFQSSVGIKNDGSLWALGGRNFCGELGINNESGNYYEARIGSSNDWDKVFPGPLCFYAIKTNGTLWSWGLNGAQNVNVGYTLGIDGTGQLGLGNSANRSSPTQVGALTGWKDVASASNYNGGRAILIKE
jgi:alpha-tubulin suppressor-like RCC1 family protein